MSTLAYDIAILACCKRRLKSNNASQPYQVNFDTSRSSFNSYSPSILHFPICPWRHLTYVVLVRRRILQNRTQTCPRTKVQLAKGHNCVCLWFVTNRITSLAKNYAGVDRISFKYQKMCLPQFCLFWIRVQWSTARQQCPEGRSP